MVFAGCTALGLKMASRLREKQHALLKLIDLIAILKNQICCLGQPLTQAFEAVSEERIGGVWSCVFHACSKLMKEEQLDAGLAWKKALEQSSNILPFNQADLDELSDLGEMLGKSYRQSQASVLEQEKEKLWILAKKAEEAQRTTGKLYRNLGALSGAAAVILLL